MMHLSPRWGYIGSLVTDLRCPEKKPVGRDVNLDTPL